MIGDAHGGEVADEADPFMGGGVAEIGGSIHGGRELEGETGKRKAKKANQRQKTEERFAPRQKKRDASLVLLSSVFCLQV
jgi:hypothetical protein